MSGLYDSQPGPLDIAGMNPIAIDWWNQGGLVLIKWSPFNPWTGNSYQDHTGVNLSQLLVEGSAAHDLFFDWLDQIAAGLADLRDAGVVVLWRPMSEMTGGWFWWGRQPRLEYVDLWRQMHEYFSVDKGLDNLIWVYESAQSEHAVVASDYYYPGDDVVDVVGHNLYDDDWVLAWDLDQVFRRYPKTYGIPQAGPDDVLDGSWPTTVMIDTIRERFRRVSFFSAWSSFWNGFDHRMAIVDNQFASELMHDPWIVTRERLGGRGGALFGDDLETGDLCAWSPPPPP
jgi:mannan endo-1,4-beta-mannosidase